jgi:isopropylmalate/homocitrate/citramalate synthase/4-hydroxybenzoate polyprenyltransferase
MDGRPRKATVRTTLFAHLETWRPYTAFYVGLAGLAGAGLTDADADGRRLAVAWGVPTLAWIGGLYGGDYFDRDLDRIAKPHRPIPSGRIAARTAWVALWVCVTVGATLAAVVNPRTALIAAAALACGIAYSRALKAYGVAGNLVRGAMMAGAVVFGAMTVQPWPGPEVLLPALGLWAHDVATNLVGTIRDVEGDRAGGYRTVPVRRGVRVAGLLAAGCFAVALLAALATLLERPNDGAIALLVAATVAGGVAFGLLAGADPGDPDGHRAAALRAHSVLLTERVLLASALIAVGLGGREGLLAAGLAVPATVLAERALRGRHERTGIEESAEENTVTPADVDAYVDAQLAAIARRPSPLRGLDTWRRDIRIALRDPAHHVRLVTGDGLIRRAGPAEEFVLPVVTVTTSGDVFRDIFLTRRSNPRRAFLLGRLRFDGSAADMVHANGIFAEFLRTGTKTAAVVREPAPEPVFELASTMPARVVISDTTLRDGEQMPGVAFDTATKVRIARLLDDLGVGVIEAGFPAVSAAEAAAVREVAGLGLSAVTQAIARPLEADIDAAAATGVDTVAIFVGTSDPHVLRKLRTTRTALIGRVVTAVAHARAAGLGVVFAAEDAVRTDPRYLVDVYTAAVEAGADAVGVADTAGIAHPARFAAVVRTVAAAVPVPIGVHCHDDLGLATANTLAGVAAGASGAQGSVLGVGERAGNAALEEIALALEVAHGVPTGLNLRVLPELAAVVSRAAGLAVPVNKPVLGGHAFVHESGLHVDGLLRDPATYEPYPPELIGATRRIVLGKHSGRSCVQSVLDRHGLELSRERVDELVAYVKAAGGPVAPEDLITRATALPLAEVGR